jgi:hypothetical protein
MNTHIKSCCNISKREWRSINCSTNLMFIRVYWSLNYPSTCVNKCMHYSHFVYLGVNQVYDGLIFLYILFSLLMSITSILNQVFDGLIFL